MGADVAVGETTGPQAIVVRHYEQVRRFLRRRLQRQPGDADDLAQEVCVRFLVSYRGQPLDCPLAYLLAIAANALASFVERAKRERELFVIDTELLSDWSASEAAGVGPTEKCIAEFDLPRLLKQLPGRHRAVLVAHKLHGYSYAEAAAQLGLSELTVEKYLTQARLRLRSSRLVREAGRAGCA
jgi:RNA polymerase sigma-70 factor (ECF subfamily)